MAKEFTAIRRRRDRFGFSFKVQRGCATIFNRPFPSSKTSCFQNGLSANHQLNLRIFISMALRLISL